MAIDAEKKEEEKIRGRFNSTAEESFRSSDPAAFENLSPGMQFLALLIMMMAQSFASQESDGELEEDAGPSIFWEILSQALGFTGVEETREWAKSTKGQDARENYNQNLRGKVDFPKASRALAIGGIPKTGSANFDEAVKVVLKVEGGYNPNEPGGGSANFGINGKANGLTDAEVRNLTPEKAMAIYKRKYWDTIPGIEKMDRASALVAFDASVNHGPGFAREMLQNTGGDPAAMLEYRRAAYARLAQNNPGKYAPNAKGWENRLSHIEKSIRSMTDEKQTSARDTVINAPGTATAAFSGTGSLVLRPPVEGFRQSSDFGKRNVNVPGASAFHRGMDYATPVGTKLAAQSPATVAYYGPSSGFGNVAVLRTSVKGNDGETYHINQVYGHIDPSTSKYIRTGQTIKPGQTFAVTGKEGIGNAHLHYELHVEKNGQSFQIDPENAYGKDLTDSKTVRTLLIDSERQNRNAGKRFVSSRLYEARVDTGVLPKTFVAAHDHDHDHPVPVVVGKDAPASSAPVFTVAAAGVPVVVAQKQEFVGPPAPKSPELTLNS